MAPIPPPPRLLDRVRAALRTRHYSRRTEKAYVGWIRRFILFHGKRHPSEMGAAEITRFLSALAIERNVAASTQNQALSALLFLYREVLGRSCRGSTTSCGPSAPARLPVVLTRDEVRTVLAALDGPTRLLALLLYGAGLRLLEAARLRVKDVDFERSEITVREGKGGKDRVTMLPAAARRDLREAPGDGARLHERDLAAGAGLRRAARALGRKYPNAGREWVWQWVFPATRTYFHPRDRRSAAATTCTNPSSSAPCATRSAVGHPQARHLPHPPPLLRHPPARGRLRHPHRPGAPRPPRRRHHHDLHPRPQPRPRRRPEPRRPPADPLTLRPPLTSRIPKYPGPCNTGGARRAHAQPRILQARSGHSHPAIPAGLSKPTPPAPPSYPADAELCGARYI